ncbi:MAG: fatty acid hydroxylase family protein [Deltaproteobacteria bacterium]|nr:MAG: fatty acid hydroxylase family protein [Deltaproteobacteria bacterium]
MEAYATALLYAIPGFTVLMAIEFSYGALTGKQTFRMMDSISSISSGLTNIIKDSLGLLVILISYPFLLKYLAVYKLPTTWYVFLIAFVAKDFASYWDHRMNHMINGFWNRHVIHHSSEEFNLPCALRQPISVIFGFFPLFLLPAAIVGVPYKVIAVIAPIHLFLQFWYHTKHIGKLGFLEYIIVTPSQHRVHHAINPAYIDKNFSAIFCIWDRMFGTFQEEMDDVPPVYGVLTPVRTWNPIRINFQHNWKLLKDAWNTQSWKERFQLWIRPTGYRPDDVKQQYTYDYIDDVYAYEKYDPPATLGFKVVSFLHMVFSVLLLLWMFYAFGKLSSYELLQYGGLIFVGVYGYTAMMDGDRLGPWVETLRAGFGLWLLYSNGQWFGLDSLLPGGSYLVASYFGLTLLAAWYFYATEEAFRQGKKPPLPAQQTNLQPTAEPG